MSRKRKFSEESRQGGGHRQRLVEQLLVEQRLVEQQPDDQRRDIRLAQTLYEEGSCDDAAPLVKLALVLDRNGTEALILQGKLDERAPSVKRDWRWNFSHVIPPRQPLIPI